MAPRHCVGPGPAAREASGAPLGCVTYARDRTSPWAVHAEEGEAAIRMLAVVPAVQGRGVGTALVVACVERARADGRPRDRARPGSRSRRHRYPPNGRCSRTERRIGRKPTRS